MSEQQVHESDGRIVRLPEPDEHFGVPDHGHLVATSRCTVNGHDAVRARKVTSEDHPSYRVVDDDSQGIRVDIEVPEAESTDWTDVNRFYNGLYVSGDDRYAVIEVVAPDGSVEDSVRVDFNGDQPIGIDPQDWIEDGYFGNEYQLRLVFLVAGGYQFLEDEVRLTEYGISTQAESR